MAQVRWPDALDNIRSSVSSRWSCMLKSFHTVKAYALNKGNFWCQLGVLAVHAVCLVYGTMVFGHLREVT
ncbi:hypothetical protein VTO42DRAFT_2160 [Malbranchea cinnamomea]